MLNVTGTQTFVITNPNQMHSAFDPNGTDVFCDFANIPAKTNAGHCQYCGETNHQAL